MCLYACYEFRNVIVKVGIVTRLLITFIDYIIKISQHLYNK